MTSLALRLNQNLCSSTVNTVLGYLDTPESTSDVQKQKKIQDLVTSILTGCWPKTVMYLPLPGKPDTRFQLDPLLKSPRSRVVQLGQKKDACWLYALQRIRMHVGKNPPEQFKLMRMTEKKTSELRKGLKQISKDFRWQSAIAKHEIPGYSLVTKKNIVAVLKDVNKIMHSEYVEKARSLYKKFKQSNMDTLVDFVKANYLNELQGPLNTYLSLNNIPLGTIYNSDQRSLYSREWEDLNSAVKVFCLTACAFKVTYENYRLDHSSWHPTDLIEELGEQIELHGPHVITGDFGEGFYEQGLFKTSCKIEGRSVYAWRPNAKKIIDSEADFHAVVLVGVDCDNKHVFFIDPLNPSDPKEPLQEKMYVISYGNLKRNIFPLDGTSIMVNETRKLFSDRPYALHGDPELARL